MSGAARIGGWLAAGVVVLGAHYLGAAALTAVTAPTPHAPEATVIELLSPEEMAAGAPLDELPGDDAAALADALPPLPSLAQLTQPEFPDPVAPEPRPDDSPPPEPLARPLARAPEPEAQPVAEPLAAPDPPAAAEPEPMVEELSAIPTETVIAPVRPPARPDTLRRRVEPAAEPATKAEPARRADRAREPERAQANRGAPAPGQPSPRQPEQPQRAAPLSGQGGSSAAPSAQEVASWESRVRQITARHMSAARVSARGQLTATLALRIDGGGAVQVSLAQGSGDAAVDSGLARHARRLPRLPAPPDGRPRNVMVPFRIVR